MTVKPNKRTYAIAMYLLSGWAPWGVDLAYSEPDRRAVSLHGRRWIMCCGHVLSHREAAAWVEAGLAVEGLNRHGGRALLAGPRLSQWVSSAFDGLLARRWGRA